MGWLDLEPTYILDIVWQLMVEFIMPCSVKEVYPGDVLVIGWCSAQGLGMVTMVDARDFLGYDKDGIQPPSNIMMMWLKQCHFLLAMTGNGKHTVPIYLWWWLEDRLFLFELYYYIIHLVGGMEHLCILHNIWDNSSQLTFIFFKTVKTTNQ